jgi:nitrate reductase NapD
VGPPGGCDRNAAGRARGGQRPRPNLAAPSGSILAIKGADVYARDDRGKLVVVLESMDGGDPIGAALTEISTMQHVISATLVYHHSDADPTAEKTT